MKNELSICIISRNEEKGIKRCIESIISIADEIIVVDTRSTDKTKEVVESYNGKVIDAKWENDFSKIRNISLNYATKEWILVLDCDEEIEVESLEKIKNIIDNEDKEGYYLVLRNIVSGKTFDELPIFRLFKNDSRYRFKGKLHEQIAPTIKFLEGEKSLGRSDIVIKHYGYDKGLYNIKEKSNRNLSILLSYEEDEKNGYYYYALGNEYARLKENNKALGSYKISDKLSILNNNIEENYYPILILNTAKLLYTENKFIDCINLIDEKLKILISFKDLYFLRFLCCNNIGKLTDSKNSLENYLEIEDNSKRYPVINYGDKDNMKLILENLKSVSIGENGKVSVIIISENSKEILQSIKCINEISDDIKIFINDNIQIDIDRANSFDEEVLLRKVVFQYGVNEVYCEKDKTLKEVIELLKYDYFLILYSDEIVTHEYCKEILRIIQKNRYKAIVSRVIDKDKKSYVLEYRFINKKVDLIINEGKIQIKENQDTIKCVGKNAIYKI